MQYGKSIYTYQMINIAMPNHFNVSINIFRIWGNTLSGHTHVCKVWPMPINISFIGSYTHNVYCKFRNILLILSVYICCTPLEQNVFVLARDPMYYTSMLYYWQGIGVRLHTLTWSLLWLYISAQCDPRIDKPEKSWSLEGMFVYV